MTKPAAHSGEWETPPELFEELDREFGFTLDAACTASNCKCSHFMLGDSLQREWANHPAIERGKLGAIFLNPPYGNVMPWVRKALMESMRGATVVCVLPGVTDAAWYHEYVLRANEIRFLRGRVKFEYKGTVPKNGPTKGTMIAVFRGLEEPFSL